eukprot:TRINITY_DN4585_c0_g1_i14.p1 TRINITY_DN4585_c0_g1~~TRINITY_DN4585_c0_g1_i14.p1  ORF type:complete len:149 (+),score=54.82 TRINITY_DN4585_c0_g1_i14:145-591(+)
MCPQLEIWDTAGQEALQALRRSSYNETDLFLVAYDMTDPKSLEDANNWLEEIEEFWEEQGLDDLQYDIIMVGCKQDLYVEKQAAGAEVTTLEKAKEMLEAIKGRGLVYTSAKTAYGLCDEQADTMSQPEGTTLMECMLQVVLERQAAK